MGTNPSTVSPLERQANEILGANLRAVYKWCARRPGRTFVLSMDWDDKACEFVFELDSATKSYGPMFARDLDKVLSRAGVLACEKLATDQEQSREMTMNRQRGYRAAQRQAEQRQAERDSEAARATA